MKNAGFKGTKLRLISQTPRPVVTGKLLSKPAPRSYMARNPDILAILL
jgi:hypothetical protein